MAFTLARRADRGGEEAHFVCPMHPEVTSAGPGECPICRMALERFAAKPAPSPESAPDAGAASEPSFTVSGEAARLLEASVGPVERVAASHEVLAPAWLERDVVMANLYDDELAALSPTESGSFTTAAAPGVEVAVRREPDAPIAWDRSTSQVRFRIVTSNAALPERGAGRLRIAHVSRDALVVPAAAVLSSADGPYVLSVSSDRRSLGRRPVAIGRVSSGRASIVAGLREEDLIVARDAFFFDAERRLSVERSRAMGERP